MKDKGFLERVNEAFERTETAHTIIVDSEAAMRELELIIAKEHSSHPYTQIVAIDYSLQQPLANVIDSNQKLASTRALLRDGLRANDCQESLRRGEMISTLFSGFEELGIVSYLFVQNPQKMDIKQCMGVSGLIEAIQNSSRLEYTFLYLPGGDWWRREEFWPERLPDGNRAGCLSYVRPRCERFDYGVGLTHADVGKLKSADSALNIHGHHFSGKSALLEMLNTLEGFESAKSLVTVYPELSGDAGDALFLAEIRRRGVSADRALYVDGADKLSAGAFDTVKKAYPKLICTSIHPMNGFERYFNTMELLKRTQ